MKILENKFDLGFLPTPLHKLKNLSDKYEDYNIYIKRDDQTGLASGGNKTRKLEYLIQEAIDNGCDTIITGGAQQSNHCRQTAAACSVAGLQCHLMLGGDGPETPNGNLLLSNLLGAKIYFAAEDRKGEGMELLKEELMVKGKKPIIIPYGGSSSNGAMGYVNATKELKDQLKELDITIDYIFFASSSGGTLAGFILGKELFGLTSELIPINIDKTEIQGLSLEEKILDIVNDGKKMLNLKKEYSLRDINLIRGYDKTGYGVIGQNEKEAIKELAVNEGILLDPVYSGRAFYGLMDFLKNKKVPVESNILFYHTGGLPANFAYANYLV
ncbi:D-cysteine desulfhydrase family protein [Allomuricauda sp. CP2A]|jgi:D-cysteine desulfhydrase|uniref:D-cysteine desulfhydrase family protein n=1 Tax=Allomuricauda sp. CP2A TaxID=1848189 RepID=UPI00082C66FE|nr:D-cysteine desulfhydrase family protein [Muricauda sp. CP2A]